MCCKMDEVFRSLLACKQNDTAFFIISNQIVAHDEKSIFYIVFDEQGLPITLTKANRETLEFLAFENNTAIFVKKLATQEIDFKIVFQFYGHAREDCFNATQSIPFGDHWITQYVWNFCRIKK